jgi:hypothetical protein
MFTSDSQTYDSLRKLYGLSTRTGKQALIWIGSGTSSWLGYERWAGLAQRFHRAFLRAESGYPRADAARKLDEDDYPAVFQMCRDTSPQRYFSLLADSFTPLQMTPVFERFLNALRSLGQCSIITTNVDESLERWLPGFVLVQRSDLSRTLSLVASKVSFIAKVHGSISGVQSTVFTSQDYDALMNDAGFIEVLRTLLTTCSVVFVGYSLRDRYLFRLLERNAQLLSLFGDAPHFLISSEERSDLPETVNVIRYLSDLHSDHRSCILELELMCRPTAEIESLNHGPQTAAALQSAHFLSDFYPGGTWTMGTRLGLRGEDGSESELLVGPDWSVEEWPSPLSTAAFDLAVGLICFDRVFLPIDTLGRAHQMLGSQLFWHLVAADVVRFLRWEGADGLLMPNSKAGYGRVVIGKDVTRSLREVIARQLSSVPGKEREAAERFTLLEGKTEYCDLSRTVNFADLCNGLLVAPNTRSMLGLSDATPVGHVPRWIAPSVLRLAQIARVGATCQMLGVASMKLMTGCAPVAEAAFSAVAGGSLAHEAASYTLTGQFGLIPEAALSTPENWGAILRFRDTQAGANLRAQVLRCLQANQGAEIAASIDASLRNALPTQVLAEARTAMSALLLASRGTISVTPGIWSDAFRLWDGPAAWRKKAKTRLESYLRESALGPYDPCPCGSCEKVKFCCQAALRS